MYEYVRISLHGATDPTRKTEAGVHVHVSTEHARNVPLREWGPNPHTRLLALAFPHLFPFGLTSFNENERAIPWSENEFGDWLRHLPFLHYAAAHVYRICRR